MSLQVWLPLNGDLHNQGLLNWQPTLDSGTNATYASGKIGQALNTGAITMPATITAQILNNNTYSYACWFCALGASGSTSERAMIFGNDGMSALGGRQFSLFQYSTANDLHWSWQNYTGGTYSSAYGGVLSGVFPTNQWVHLAVTYDNPNVKIYINGQIRYTGSWVANADSFAYDTKLIWNSQYHKINDVRLYNHALSDHEVEEIAKGLVLHYKLDNNGLGNLNLVKGNYSAITTATTNNVSGTLSFDTSIMSFNDLKGKTLYFSYDYSVEGAKLYNNTGDYTKDRYGIHGNLSYVDSSGTTKTTYPFAGYLTASGTGRAIQSYIVPADAQQINSLTFGLQPFNKPAANSTATWYIKNCKLEIGRATSYTPNQNDIHQNSSIIYDSSGYNNNGTIVGSLETTTPSPRYNCAMHHLDSCADYIYTDALTFLGNSGFTFACWAQCNNYTRTTNGTASIGNQFIVSQGRDYRETSDKSYGASIVMYNGTPSWYCGNGAVSSNIQIPLNIWCYIVGTYDGSVKKIYINGELKNSVADTQVNWENNTGNKLVIGKMSHGYTGTTTYFPFVGNISDVRIYATALTEAQIKELYRTSMIVNGTSVTARSLE